LVERSEAALAQACRDLGDQIDQVRFAQFLLFRTYLTRSADESGAIAWGLMRLAWSSIAALAIAPLQDVLNLGAEARMNTPGQAHGNWRWRCTEEMLEVPAFEWLRELTDTSSRASVCQNTPARPDDLNELKRRERHGSSRKRSDDVHAYRPRSPDSMTFAPCAAAPMTLGSGSSLAQRKLGVFGEGGQPCRVLYQDVGPAGVDESLGLPPPQDPGQRWGRRADVFGQVLVDDWNRLALRAPEAKEGAGNPPFNGPGGKILEP
jgi:hypothetical protein